ncbi:hypothetical protein G9A89_007582 [Geosiphon pyriformis]|nr:hypothetical protein G9A89_007582 [Geosiphon pyriformis]
MRFIVQPIDFIGLLFSLLAFFLTLFVIAGSGTYSLRGVHHVELRLTNSTSLQKVLENEPTWVRFGFYGYCYGRDKHYFLGCVKKPNGLTVSPFSKYPLEILNIYFPNVVTNLTQSSKNGTHSTGIPFISYLILVLLLISIVLNIFHFFPRLYNDKYYTRGFLLSLAVTSNLLSLGLALDLYTRGLRALENNHPEFAGSFGPGIYFLGFSMLAASIGAGLFLKESCSGG